MSLIPSAELSAAVNPVIIPFISINGLAVGISVDGYLGETIETER